MLCYAVYAMGRAEAGHGIATTFEERVMPSPSPSRRPTPPPPAYPPTLASTSSAPKAVVHNYQTMLANNRIAEPIYNMTRDDIVLGGPPFTHAFGICVLNLTLMVGAASLLMPAFTPPKMLELVESGKPTVIFVAPAHVAA